MKALTVLNPWAAFLALRKKRIETRGWQTPYRGPLAIHAGKATADAEAFNAEMRAGGNEPWPMVYGAIIAVGNLVRIVRTEGLGHISDQEREMGNYAPGRFGWFLEDVMPLSRPVIVRGQQGLWEVPHPVERLVDLRAYEAAAMAWSEVINNWQAFSDGKHTEDRR